MSHFDLSHFQTFKYKHNLKIHALDVHNVYDSEDPFALIPEDPLEVIIN